MNKLHKKINIIFSFLFYFVIVFICSANLSFSEDSTSSSFRISDSVLTSGGGYSSSGDYTLNSTVGQIVTGTSSATIYNLSPDFQYYPIVTIPVISATAGNDQVALSWTAAVGELGWLVSSYNIGVSTISGGS